MDDSLSVILLRSVHIFEGILTLIIYLFLASPRAYSSDRLYS